jgi:hypothetical protein
MGPVKRLGASLAIAIALTVAHGAAAQPADETLVVRTSLPSAAKFGDPVETRVTVLARRDAVDLGSIRVTAPLIPLTRLGATRVTRVERGPLAVLTYVVTSACLEQRCVAAKGPTVLHLPRARVTATATDGRDLSVAERWPELTVVGRVPAGVSASTGHFRTEVDPPPVTYRVSPDRLTALLLLAAGALAVAAVALGAVRAIRLARRRSQVPLTELERAIALARQAERRSPDDRRRAVSLLSRVLRPREPDLAGEASTLAWSRPEPTSQSVSSLVDDVGRTAGAR